MRFVYFTHSLQSCWNHGNAHFLRGVLRELISAGHQATAVEPVESWSRSNLLADAGIAALEGWRAYYPGLDSVLLAEGDPPDPLVDAADVVIVHEWTAPALVARLGALRRAGAPWLLLFHDTHHRAVSDPAAMQAFDLSGYDAVLAFGAALAAVYRRWGWESRAFIWHEAADTTLFRPPRRPGSAPGRGLDRQLGRRRAHRRAGDVPAGPRSPAPASRSTSTASATRPRRCRCSSSTARAITAGCPTTPPPPCSPATH